MKIECPDTILPFTFNHSEYIVGAELPPIKESISGVNLDRLWATLGRHINGEEAIYGGADNRLFASG